MIYELLINYISTPIRFTLAISTLEYVFALDMKGQRKRELPFPEIC